MKSPLGLLLAPLLVIGCAHPSDHAIRPGTVSDNQSIHEELLRLNRGILEPMILENDPSMFLMHSDEKFVVIAPGGILENREQAAAGAQNFDATAVSFTDEQVRIVGSTAVVTGRLDIDGEVGPHGRPAPMKFMSIFVQQKSGWKLFARSLTPCAPIAIERGRC